MRSDFYFDTKKGLWRKQVTIGGKRKVFSAKTKKQVLLKIMEYKEEASRLPTFLKVSEEWEEVHWNAVRTGSLRSYTAPLRRIREQFGSKEIDKISPKEVQAYLNELAQRFSAKSVSQHKSILSMVFNYGIVEMGLDIQNPVSVVKLPPGMRKTTRESLSPEAKKAVSTPDFTFLLPFVIYYTGTRCGEALALQMSDVDFKENTISITKAVHHEGNRPVIGNLKTANSYRVVPLLDPLKKALLSLDLSKNDYLVSGECPMTKSALSKRWLRWCKQNDLMKDGKPAIDRHTIRHQYATTLYEAGISPKSAQLLLGHADIRTTMNIYTHLSDEQRKKDFEMLNNFVN